MKTIMVLAALTGLLAAGCASQQMNQGAATDTDQNAYTTGSMPADTHMEDEKSANQAHEVVTESSETAASENLEKKADEESTGTEMENNDDGENEAPEDHSPDL